MRNGIIFAVKNAVDAAAFGVELNMPLVSAQLFIYAAFGKKCRRRNAAGAGAARHRARRAGGAAGAGAAGAGASRARRRARARRARARRRKRGIHVANGSVIVLAVFIGVAGNKPQAHNAIRFRGFLVLVKVFVAARAQFRHALLSCHVNGFGLAIKLCLAQAFLNVHQRDNANHNQRNNNGYNNK